MSFAAMANGVERFAHPSSILRVYCLGTFQVIRPGESTAMAVGSRQKAWTLFKYLVANRGTAIATDTIMNMFWPDRPDPGDTAPLRTAISRLTSQLEPARARYDKPTYLLYNRDVCSFNPDSAVWLDTDEFERLYHTAKTVSTTDRLEGATLYERALELYRGDYLAEDVYTDWTTVEREHYRRLFLDSAREAATWFLQVGDLESARTLLERAVELDPLLEELHTLLVQVLVAAGDYKAAITHYTQSTSLLYDELGVRPSESLRRVYEQAREAHAGTGTADGAGRPATHLAKIEKLLGARGHTRGALICGADVFQELLLLERRRMMRAGTESILIFVQAVQADTGLDDRAALDLLQPLAHDKLRQGDVICRPDDHHLVLLCASTSEQLGRIVIRRIEDAFRANHPSHRVVFRSNIRPLEPLRPESPASSV